MYIQCHSTHTCWALSVRKWVICNDIIFPGKQRQVLEPLRPRQRCTAAGRQLLTSVPANPSVTPRGLSVGPSVSLAKCYNACSN